MVFQQFDEYHMFFYGVLAELFILFYCGPRICVQLYMDARGKTPSVFKEEKRVKMRNTDKKDHRFHLSQNGQSGHQSCEMDVEGERAKELRERKENTRRKWIIALGCFLLANKFNCGFFKAKLVLKLYLILWYFSIFWIQKTPVENFAHWMTQIYNNHLYTSGSTSFYSMMQLTFCVVICAAHGRGGLTYTFSWN